MSDWPGHIIDLPPGAKAELMLRDPDRYMAQCRREEGVRAREYVRATLDRVAEERRQRAWWRRAFRWLRGAS